MLRKLKKAQLLILPLLLVLSGCFWSDDKTLRVGVGFDSPIFAMQKDEQVVGFGVDAVKMVAAKLEKQPIFKEFASNSALLRSLKAGDVDLILLNNPQNEEKSLALSTPYHESRLAALYDPEKVLLRSEADLAGKAIGVDSSSVAEFFVRESNKLLGATVFSELSTQGLLELLDAGEISAILTDAKSAFSLVHSHPKLQAITITTPIIHVLGVRKNDIELLQKLNSAIAALKADGNLRELETKWLERAAPLYTTDAASSEQIIADSILGSELENMTQPATPEQHSENALPADKDSVAAPTNIDSTSDAPAAATAQPKELGASNE